MKSFSYIQTLPYKGNLLRLPTWPGTPFFDQQGTVNAPHFAAISLAINWADYTNPIVAVPPVNAALGVAFNLRGTNTPAIRRIEACYIDNSFNSLPVYVVFPDTNYMVLGQAYSVSCVPVYSMEQQAKIYCEGFDGIISPATRVMMLEKYVANWNIAPPSTPTIVDPTFVTSSHGSGNGAPTLAANLPASIVSGNYLLMAVNSFSSQTVNTPTGWQLLGTFIQNFTRITLFGKVATGSEGATVNLTISSGSMICGYGCVQIQHYTQGGPAVAGPSGGTGAAPQPPTITPVWGNAINLTIAICVTNNGAVNTVPAGYTSLFTENGNSAIINMSYTTKAYTAETPGPYGLGSAVDFGVATVAFTNI